MCEQTSQSATFNIWQRAISASRGRQPHCEPAVEAAGIQHVASRYLCGERGLRAEWLDFRQAYTFRGRDLECVLH